MPNITPVQSNLQKYQLLQELHSWQRTLEFYKQENSYLKYRLSHTLDQTDEEGFLHMAENFQNKFLLNDVAIDKIKIKIEGLLNELGNAGDNELLMDLRYRQNKFRGLFHKFERSFLSLIKEFNEQILSPFSFRV